MDKIQERYEESIGVVLSYLLSSSSPIVSKTKSKKKCSLSVAEKSKRRLEFCKRT